MLLTYREGLNGPDDLTVLWDPLDAAHSGLKFRRVSIGGDRDMDLYVVSRRPPLELTLGLMLCDIHDKL